MIFILFVIDMKVNQLLQLSLFDGLVEHLRYVGAEAFLHQFVINEGSNPYDNSLVTVVIDYFMDLTPLGS